MLPHLSLSELFAHHSVILRVDVNFLFEFVDPLLLPDYLLCLRLHLQQLLIQESLKFE